VISLALFFENTSSSDCRGRVESGPGSGFAGSRGLEYHSTSSVVFSPSSCLTLLQTSLHVLIACSGLGRKTLLSCPETKRMERTLLTSVVSLSLYHCTCAIRYSSSTLIVDVDLDLAVRVFANRHLAHFPRRSPDRLPTLPHSHYTRPSRTPHSPLAIAIAHARTGLPHQQPTLRRSSRLRHRYLHPA
jgi:hypothetical protein